MEGRPDEGRLASPAIVERALMIPLAGKGPGGVRMTQEEKAARSARGHEDRVVPFAPSGNPSVRRSIVAGLLGEMTLPSHENFVKTDAYPKLMMLGRIAVMPLVREVFGGYKHAETASEEAI